MYSDKILHSKLQLISSKAQLLAEFLGITSYSQKHFPETLHFGGNTARVGNSASRLLRTISEVRGLKWWDNEENGVAGSFADPLPC